MGFELQTSGPTLNTEATNHIETWHVLQHIQAVCLSNLRPFFFIVVLVLIFMGLMRIYVCMNINSDQTASLTTFGWTNCTRGTETTFDLWVAFPGGPRIEIGRSSCAWWNISMFWCIHHFWRHTHHRVTTISADCIHEIPIGLVRSILKH